MAGGKGKGKGKSKYKYEKLDLATLDATPSSSSRNVWGQTTPTPASVNTWNPQASLTVHKDVQEPPSLGSSPSAMSTSSERFDNWNRFQDAWRGPAPMFGQTHFAPVCFPYCTIVPEVGRWIEGENYPGEWEAAPFCKVDDDWSKPEVQKGFIKRTDDRGKFRVHLFPALGGKQKKQDLSYSQKATGPVTQEPWDYAVLYKKTEEPESVALTDTNKAKITQGHPDWRQPQKQKKKLAKGKKSNKKSRLGLDDFPDEVLERILRFSLQHHEPLSVDLFWQHQPWNEPPALDYRLMHASKRLYRIGIELYYKLNTWIVDITPMVYKEDKYISLGNAPTLPLGMFQSLPKSVEKNQWTTIKDLHIARECVRRVILVNHHHQWHPACTFLRGFDNLEEVTFDLRGTGVISDKGWETVEVEDPMKEAAEKAGIHIPSGKLRAGHTCISRARGEMEVQLAPGLISGSKQYRTDEP